MPFRAGAERLQATPVIHNCAHSASAFTDRAASLCFTSLVRFALSPSPGFASDVTFHQARRTGLGGRNHRSSQHDREPCVQGNSQIKSTELAANVLFGVLFLRIVENRLGRAVLDHVTCAPAIRSVDVKKSGHIGDPLRLLKVMESDQNA